MAFVKVDETEPIEKAIKRFKRMVEKEGVIREYKMRRYFEKPSAIQHRKNKAMARKQMLKNKKMHASTASSTCNCFPLYTVDSLSVCFQTLEVSVLLKEESMTSIKLLAITESENRHPVIDFEQLEQP